MTTLLKQIRNFIKKHLQNKFVVFWDKESYKFLTSITNITHGVIVCEKKDLPTHKIIFNKNTIIIEQIYNYDVNTIVSWVIDDRIMLESNASKYFGLEYDYLIIHEDYIYLDKSKNYIKYGIVIDDPSVNLDYLIDLLIWI